MSDTRTFKLGRQRIRTYRGPDKFAVVEIEVDFDSLVNQLAGKALNSRTGKAVYIHGAVTIRAKPAEG